MDPNIKTVHFQNRLCTENETDNGEKGHDILEKTFGYTVIFPALKL